MMTFASGPWTLQVFQDNEVHWLLVKMHEKSVKKPSTFDQKY